jgi:putative endonuclease
MNWYLYIAKARTGRFYTGISTDPAKRIARHNRGEGARFAIQQGPFELVYISPPFTDKSTVRKREIQIKDWSQVKKNRLISGEII